MNTLERLTIINEINEEIIRLENERSVLNDSNKLPVFVEIDWSDDEYPYTVVKWNKGRKLLLGKYGSSEFAFRSLVREIIKILEPDVN